MTVFAVVEPCGVDWYLSECRSSRFEYRFGTFVDMETGKRWVGPGEFAAYLKSQA